MTASDLIVELKITNLSDWAIIQPLLQRLKITFVQKETPQTFIAEPIVAYTQKEHVTEFVEQPISQLDTLVENTYIWSPYDAYDAAEVLLKAMKNNKNIAQV